MALLSQRGRALVLGAVLLLCGLIVGFQVVQGSQGRAAAERLAARDADLMAWMLARHSQQALKTVDLLLDRAVLERNSGKPGSFPAGFRTLAASLNYVRDVVVLTGDGAVIAGLAGRRGPEDLERLRDAGAAVARNGADVLLPGVMLPANDVATVVVGRRPAAETGPAAAVATLDASEFSDCCLLADQYGPNTASNRRIATTLITEDGRDLLRPGRDVTGLAGLVSRGDAGTLHAERTLSGRPGQVAFVRISAPPMIAVAAVDDEAAFAGWLQDVEAGAFRAGWQILAVVACGLIALRLLRRHEEYERALAAQTTLLRATVDSIGQGISVFDGNGRLSVWNQRFVDMREVPPDLAVAGAPLSAFFQLSAERGEYGPGDPKVLAARQLAELVAGPPPPTSERTLPSGTTVELRTAIMPDGGYVTTYTDVTERRRTESVLRATVERFRLLFERTPTIAVQGYDYDRRAIFWNAASESLYGRPRDEALGYRFEDLVVPPGQRATAVGEIAEWLSTGRAPLPGERLRRRRDGSPVPVFSSYAMLTNPVGQPEFYCIDVDLSESRRTQDALRESEGRFRDYADATSDWFWEMGPDLRFTGFSERMTSTIHLTPEQLYGRTRLELAGVGIDDPHWRPYIEATSRRLPFRDFVYPVQRGAITGRSGQDICYVKVSGKPVFGADGSFLGYRGTATEITAQVEAEKMLRKLSEAVEQCPASIIITDAVGTIEYVNRRFTLMTGYQRGEVVDQGLSVLRSDYEDGQPALEPGALLDGVPEWRGEVHTRRKDGSLFWELTTISPITTSGNGVSHFLVIGEDISERKFFEERLLHQANYDALTGLPNRLLLLDRLQQGLARGRRERVLLAVLFVDLDHFKVINEALGHDAGDRLLLEATRRLGVQIREGDTLARFGSDEFVIILPDLPASPYADAAAHRILEAFSKPFIVESREFFVTASIGITLAPTDGDDVQGLLRNADAAMRQAKSAGRNTCRFFTPEMNRRVSERLSMETRLRHAVAKNELSLVYQPIVETRTGAVSGAEALLRWNNPDLGQVPPDHFIPLAEETGLIVEIGEWVLHRACLEAGAWQALAGRPVGLAVNLSASQFRHMELVNSVAEALRVAGLPVSCLDLEITERLLVENAATPMGILDALHAMGVSISIDDFGTGYSSLSYLKHLPVQTLKIDRTFVKDVPFGPRDTALVSAIIALAHNLDLKVVGEGVETREQLDFLAAQSCDLIQGYYFSRPLAAPAFRDYLVASCRAPASL